MCNLPFAEQIQAAANAVPAARLVGTKAWIHHVHAQHQADPSNPRMDLATFKARLVEERGTLTLGRADLVQAYSRADVAASDAHVLGGSGKPMATFNFVRRTS